MDAQSLAMGISMGIAISLILMGLNKAPQAKPPRAQSGNKDKFSLLSFCRYLAAHEIRQTTRINAKRFLTIRTPLGKDTFFLNEQDGERAYSLARDIAFRDNISGVMVDLKDEHGYTVHVWHSHIGAAR